MKKVLFYMIFALFSLFSAIASFAMIFVPVLAYRTGSAIGSRNIMQEYPQIDIVPGWLLFLIAIVIFLLMVFAFIFCVRNAIFIYRKEKTKSDLAAIFILYICFVFTILIPNGILKSFPDFKLGWLFPGFSGLVDRLCKYDIGIYQLFIIASIMLISMAITAGRKLNKE